MPIATRTRRDGGSIVLRDTWLCGANFFYCCDRLEVLRALVGHIPPHPLWAELLWQRQEEIANRATASQPSLAAPSSATFDPPRRS